MRKLVIGLASILALVVAIVVFLLVHDFDSPDLGRALLDKVSAASGVTITARTFHLNLLNGLKLEGVELTSNADGRTLRMALDTLLFEHRVAPLFSGTVAIERVLLDRPAIVIVETSAAAPGPAQPAAPAAPAAAPAPAASGSDRKLSLELKELTIRDARLSATREAQPGAELLLEGLTVNLREIKFNPSVHSLAAISGSGDLALTKATLNTTVLTDIRSAFQLANAAFAMKDLSASTAFGKLTSSMTLDLKPSPFTYELKATGSAIDVNKLIGAPGGFGPGSLQLDAQGRGPAAEAVEARGSIKLAAGKLPVSKATEAVDKALGKPVLAGSPYKATEAAFVMNRGVITLSPFRFESENARVDLHGTAALAGPLAVDLSVATPRAGITIQGVGATALDVLADEAGWVPVPIQITGSLDDPRVRPDTKALLAQARSGTKREAKTAAHTAAQNAKQKAVAGLKRRKQ
jgi:uncharacterized protein involved in outer membrane biogenesis